MFEQIKTFQRVYETRSITKTAHYLFISQPSVSVRIESLEKELHVTLFTRKGKKGLVPTANADQFYRDSQRILKTWEDSKNNLDVKYRNKKTRCTIGASPLVSDRILPKLIARINYLSNKYYFTLVSGSCDEIYNQLFRHQIDFALLEKPYSSNEIETLNFMSNPFVLAGDRNLETWIIGSANSIQYKYSNLYFRENHFRPKNIIRANSDSLIQKLLLEQIGKAIISKRVIASNQISYKELPNKYRTDIYLVSHKISKSDNIDKLKRILKVQLTQMHF